MFVGQAGCLERLACHTTVRGYTSAFCEQKKCDRVRSGNRWKRRATVRTQLVNLRAAAEVKTVLVVGASRGLGKQLVDVLAPKFTVHAVARSPCGCENEHQIDAREPESVKRLLKEIQPDAVINCVASAGLGEDFPMYAATSQLVDACSEMSEKPLFLLVSALGAGDSENSIPMQVKDNMRAMLLDKSRAEKYLRTQYSNFVIPRPVPLVDDAPSGCGAVTESLNAYGAMTRTDLAVLIGEVIVSDKVSNKVLTAVDTTRLLHTSPYIRNYEFWESLPFEVYALN